MHFSVDTVSRSKPECKKHMCHECQAQNLLASKARFLIIVNEGGPSVSIDVPGRLAEKVGGTGGGNGARSSPPAGFPGQLLLSTQEVS